MSDPVVRIVGGAVLIVVGLTAWAAGIFYVARDASRRRLPDWRRWLWILLAMVPMAGLTLYVLVYQGRPAEAGSAPAGGHRARLAGAARRRVTLARAPAGFRRRLPTVPVEDLQHMTTPTTPVSAVVGQAPGRAAPVAEAPPRAVVLTVVDGPHAGQEFALGRLPARIGRGPEAAVRLDADLGVSRQHAELYEQAGVLRLRDLGSTHGTSVNGYTVDDKSLSPGDQIRVGHSLLRLKGGLA
jgi:hypothetical protein